MTPLRSISRIACSILALAIALTASLATAASARGFQWWNHLEQERAIGTRSLDGAVRALNAGAPGKLYVGGSFVNAGGNVDADHIATWDGSAWGAVGALNGDVNAIAYYAGNVYVEAHSATPA